MKLITTSVLTLLALYVLYSEPIKLPPIVKKNKKLCYILIIGSYLYYHQNNDVEGIKIWGVGSNNTHLNMHDNPVHIVVAFLLGIVSVYSLFYLLYYMKYTEESGGWWWCLWLSLVMTVVPGLCFVLLLPIDFITEWSVGLTAFGGFMLYLFLEWAKT